MNKTLQWKIAQFAEIRWWQRYLKKKTVADYLTYKKKYWKEFIHKIDPSLVFEAKDTVLDAGCGPAGIFIVLPQSKVTALDPLLEQYERELPHFSKANYPNTQFVAAPLEEYEGKEGFQHVFCLNAINHVSDLGTAFNRLVSATEKGGTLYVSIDAHNHGFLKHLFRLLPFDILHPHQYDLQEYSEMLEMRGCTVQQQIRFDKGFIFDYYLLVAKKKN